jgi:4'-phosphopantetheinyl transferase EntD
MSYAESKQDRSEIIARISMCTQFGLMITCLLFSTINELHALTCGAFRRKGHINWQTTRSRFQSGSGIITGHDFSCTTRPLYLGNKRLPHIFGSRSHRRNYVRGVSSKNGVENTIENTDPNVVIKGTYETLNTTLLCGAHCVVVRSPPPAYLSFRFSDEDDFKTSLRMYTNSKIRQTDSEEDQLEYIDELTGERTEMNCSHSIDSYTVQNDDFSTEELVFGRFKEQNNKSRLNKFIGGRVALRRALKFIGKEDSPPIFRDIYGAPFLPIGVVGSISHKDDIAVGVAAIDVVGKIGVDIERTSNKSSKLLSSRLLTQKEQDNLGSIPGISADEEVLLIFSFKESVFKAVHPYLKRSVGFREVEIEPKEDGTAVIVFLLESGELFEYEANWRRHSDKYWLTCVYLNRPVLLE